MSVPANEPLPADFPLTLYRGDTRIWQVVFADKVSGNRADLTDLTFTAQVRATRDDPTVLATLAVDTSQAATGALLITLSATDAAALTVTAASWDLQARRTSDGFVRTYLAGKVRIRGDVSRP